MPDSYDDLRRKSRELAEKLVAQGGEWTWVSRDECVDTAAKGIMTIALEFSRRVLVEVRMKGVKNENEKRIS